MAKTKKKPKTVDAPAKKQQARLVTKLEPVTVVEEPEFVAEDPLPEIKRTATVVPLADQMLSYLIIVDLHPGCSVPEFRDYSGTGSSAAHVLQELEIRGLIRKKWRAKMYRFAITEQGRKLLEV